MANGITVGGFVTKKPGVYADVNADALATPTLPYRVLTIVGDLDFLQQAKGVSVSSINALKSLAPGHPVLQKLAEIVEHPARDTRRPERIVLINTMKTTQASATLKDASGNDVATVFSDVYGPYGNSFTITTSTDPNTGDVFIDVNSYFAGTSKAKVSDTSNVLNFNYNPGTKWNDSCELNIDSNGIRVTASHSLNAAGLEVIDEETTWGGGPVTVTIANPPATSTLLEVTVTGVDADPNSPTYGQSIDEIITFTDTGPTTQITTHSFSSVTALNVTENGSVGSVYPVTFSGDRYNSGPDKTLTQVQSELNQRAIFTVTTFNPKYGNILARHVDRVVAYDLKTNISALLSVDAAAFASALDALPYLSATVADGPTGFPQDGTVALTGGTAAAASETDWDLALTEAQNIPTQVLVPLTTDSTFLSKVYDHLTVMSTIGANERQAWVGLLPNELNNLQAEVAKINNPFVHAVAQNITFQFSTGAEQLTPEFTALLLGALHCSYDVPESLTWKFVNVVSVDQGFATWTPEQNFNDVIDAGIVAIEKVASGGYRVLRHITTYVSDDNIAYTGGSAVTSWMSYLWALRDAFEKLIGTASSGATKQQLMDIGEQVTLNEIAAGRIKAYDASSIDVVDQGNVYQFNIAIAPAFAVDFIKINLALKNITQ